LINCPNCSSEHTRRGGYAIWTIYLVLIAAAVAAVLVWRLNAALAGGAVLAAAIVANLAIGQRVCLDCGTQWR
jgi:hypothetical protein